MNDVALRANDVMLRINDVALRANGVAASRKWCAPRKWNVAGGAQQGEPKKSKSKDLDFFHLCRRHNIIWPKVNIISSNARTSFLICLGTNEWCCTTCKWCDASHQWCCTTCKWSCGKPQMMRSAQMKCRWWGPAGGAKKIQVERLGFFSFVP